MFTQSRLPKALRVVRGASRERAIGPVSSEGGAPPREATALVLTLRDRDHGARLRSLGCRNGRGSCAPASGLTPATVDGEGDKEIADRGDPPKAPSPRRARA